MARPPCTLLAPLPGEARGWQHVSYRLPAGAIPALSPRRHGGCGVPALTALRPHPTLPRCKRVPSLRPLTNSRVAAPSAPGDTALPRAAVDMIKYVNRKPSVFGSVGHPINSRPDSSSPAERALRGTWGQDVTRAGANQTFRSGGNTAMESRCGGQELCSAKGKQHLEMCREGERSSSFHFKIIIIFFSRWV